jgi:hypothetical protein
VHRSRRDLERGFTKGEDFAPGANQPKATPIRAGGYAHNRPGETGGYCWVVESGVPKGKDPSIRGREPVPVPVGGRCNPNYRLGEVVLRSRAVKMSVAIGEDFPVLALP